LLVMFFPLLSSTLVFCIGWFKPYACFQPPVANKIYSVIVPCCFPFSVPNFSVVSSFPLSLQELCLHDPVSLLSPPLWRRLHRHSCTGFLILLLFFSIFLCLSLSPHPEPFFLGHRFFFFPDPGGWPLRPPLWSLDSCGTESGPSPLFPGFFYFHPPHSPRIRLYTLGPPSPFSPFSRRSQSPPPPCLSPPP